MLNEIIEYAIKAHEETNHRYGNNLPYSFHLWSVFNYATKYKDLVDYDAFRYIVPASCWLHDTIEDCRKTYNDIKMVAGLDVADIVYALTKEKGRNRAERGNIRYYTGIISTPYALFVKLCDRLANVSYSVDTDSSMLNAYKKEHKNFIEYVELAHDYKLYEPMFTELNNLLS